MDIEQARQLAKDETTLPEVLAILAKSEDYPTRRSVAANPNTPTAILLNVCREFPAEVMNNPVVPLLLLENPYIFSCNISDDLDFNYIKDLTDIEIKRLGWTTEQGRKYLIKNYGKRSRYHLTVGAIYDFLVSLKSLNSDEFPV